MHRHPAQPQGQRDEMVEGTKANHEEEVHVPGCVASGLGLAKCRNLLEQSTDRPVSLRTPNNSPQCQKPSIYHQFELLNDRNCGVLLRDVMVNVSYKETK